MVLAGQGVVLGPSFSFATDIDQGRLVPVLTDWLARELPIHAVFPHRHLVSAKVRSFIDFLAERLGPDPGWDRWKPKSAAPGTSVEASAPT